MIYNLRFRAQNAIGWGNYSDSLTIALVSLPLKPVMPFRDEILSTKTSIGVRWQAVLDGPGSGGYVKGYRLYSAVGPSAAFSLLYDGADFRTVLFRLVSSLEIG